MDRTFDALFARWKRANPGRLRRLPNQKADDLDEEDPNFEIYPLPRRRYEVRDRHKPEAHVLDVSARRFVGRCDCGSRGELPLFMCPHRLALRAYLLNLPCNRPRPIFCLPEVAQRGHPVGRFLAFSHWNRVINRPSLIATKPPLIVQRTGSPVIAWRPPDPGLQRSG